MGRSAEQADFERLRKALEEGALAAAAALLGEVDFPRQVLTSHLDHAVDSKQLDLARLLLERGADACYVCSYSDTNYTLLMSAAGKNDLEMIKLLLAHGAKKVINRTSQKGFTALDIAGIDGQGETTPLYTLLAGEGARHARTGPPRRAPKPGEAATRHDYALSVLLSSDAAFDFLASFDGFDPHYLAAQRRIWSLPEPQPSYFFSPETPLVKNHVAGGYLNHLLGNEGNHGLVSRIDFSFQIKNPLSAPLAGTKLCSWASARHSSRSGPCANAWRSFLRTSKPKSAATARAPCEATKRPSSSRPTVGIT